MDKAKRTAVIAGNWKMNMTPAKTTAFIKELAPKVAGLDGCKIVLCVPYVDIAAAVEAAKGTNIEIGAENVHMEPKGAYTGEISGEMLAECGVKYVIVGHSERRQYFGETDVTVNGRLKAGLANGLRVILCVGETLTEREQGITAETVSRQTKIALLGVSAEELKNVIIAYEPVWAIGTGKTATAAQAEEVCAAIRGVVASLYGADAAGATTIQYGGSMNAGNAAELLSMENIDGGLIGGASLKSDDFTVIVKPPADKSRWFLKKSMTAKFYKLFLSVHAHRVDFFTVEKLMRIGEKLVDCRSTDIDSLCSTFGLCAEQLFFPA